MLKTAGYINILLAVGHLAGLIWADKMFEVTGISMEMKEAALVHPFYPYLITIIVAVFFFIFGLYGLSADNKFRKMPFLKPLIFLIAGIYLLRGFGELIFDMEKQQANSILETIYSLIAVFIGLLFLVGGLYKWGRKTKLTNKGKQPD